MNTTRPTEPTNAELLEAMRSEMSAIREGMRADMATLRLDLSRTDGELKAELSAVRAKVHSQDLTIAKLAKDVERGKGEYDGLKGELMAEVGALATNDSNQNAQLAAIKLETNAIKSETVAQSAVLAEVVKETAPLRAIRKYAKWSWVAILAAPKVWEWIEFALHHVNIRL